MKQTLKVLLISIFILSFIACEKNDIGLGTHTHDSWSLTHNGGDNYTLVLEITYSIWTAGAPTYLPFDYKQVGSDLWVYWSKTITDFNDLPEVKESFGPDTKLKVVTGVDSFSPVSVDIELTDASTGTVKFTIGFTLT